MSISDLINQYYSSTQGAPMSSELEKQAQQEFFVKIATENGIDLSRCSDEQIAGLWNQVFPENEKTASSQEYDPIYQQAQLEFQEKQAAVAKVAEADYMGRVMAHSFYEELNKIASDASNESEKGPGIVDRAKKSWEGLDEKTRKRLGLAGKIVGGLGATGLLLAGAKKTWDHFRKDKEEKASTPPSPPPADAPAEPATKAASALDYVAAEYAIEKAASAGYNPDTAARKLIAVLELGPLDSEKVAFARDEAQAIDLRACELLEQAGYRVSFG